MMHVQLSFSLHFYLWLCSVLALKTAGFSLADVQSDVLLPSCLHVTAFSIDKLLCRMSMTFCDTLAHVSMRRWSVVTAAGVGGHK